MANASQCPPSAVTAPAPAAADKAVVAVPPLSVSQLDTAQVARASKALLHHMRLLAADHTEKSHKKSLLGDADADADAAALQDPIFIVLATKKFLEDRTRLVPVKIALPHSIVTEEAHVCLFTADPQRAYKTLLAHPSFPSHVSSRINRVLGIEKVRKRYKTFEARRQLFAQYDVFLCDKRIISSLPRVLGKSFYAAGTKRPIPVDLTAGLPAPARGPKDRLKPKPKPSRDAEPRVGLPDAVARELESALRSTSINLSPSAQISIKVGKASMTPAQVAANVEALIPQFVDRFVRQGWQSVRAIHLKGSRTMSLPIWLTAELWADEQDVLEDTNEERAITTEKPKRTNEMKRKWDEWEEELMDDDELAELRAMRADRKKKRRTQDVDSNDGALGKNARRSLKHGIMGTIEAVTAA